MKPIKTNEDYESALEQISKLMDSDPNPGSTDGDELEALAILVETYEKEHIQRDPPDHWEAIKFRIDQS